MKIIIDADTAFTVTLRKWTGHEYEPDCFHDMEPNFPRDNTVDADGAIHTTQAEFDDLIDWWRTEVDNANHGETGDGLVGLTAEEIADGQEWSLIVY